MPGLIRQHTGRAVRLVTASHVTAQDAAYRTHTRHTHVQSTTTQPFIPPPLTPFLTQTNVHVHTANPPPAAPPLPMEPRKTVTVGPKRGARYSSDLSDRTRLPAVPRADGAADGSVPYTCAMVLPSWDPTAECLVCHPASGMTRFFQAATTSLHHHQPYITEQSVFPTTAKIVYHDSR